MAFSNDRTFGIEIELFNVSRERLVREMQAAGFPCQDAGYNHSRTEGWKVVTDSSISSEAGTPGCELVSPVLKGEEGLRIVLAVFALLKRLRARVNHTCGFHVHVDADGMNLPGFRRLAQVYVKYEAAIDLMVKDTARRAEGGQYCRTNRTDSVPAVIAQLEKADSLEAIRDVVNPGGQEGGRYRKLNFCSYWRHRTVEFRQKEGLMDGQEAVAWVRFCVSLVDGAAKQTNEFWGRKVTATGADKGERLFSCYVNDRKTTARFAAVVAG